MHLLKPPSSPSQHLSLKECLDTGNPIGLRTGATQTAFWVQQRVRRDGHKCIGSAEDSHCSLGAVPFPIPCCDGSAL